MQDGDPRRPKVTVRVPATSANLGPGFDALGLALTLYNTVEARPVPAGLEIAVEGEGRGSIPTDESNLVWQAMLALFESLGEPPPGGVRLRLANGVPPCSGLGSSAAAIVGGLLAAQALAGRKLPMPDLLALAARLDGHPDNVAPALLGGMVIVVPTDGGYRWLRLPPAPGLVVTVALPELSVETEKARKMLPREVPLSDAAFNVGRAALLVGALSQQRLDLLGAAMEDRLHQTQRLTMVPGGASALRGAAAKGWGASLSGSGPSLLALGYDDAPARSMAAAFTEAGITCRILRLGIDHGGATVLDGVPGPQAPHGPDPATAPLLRRRVVVQKYGGTSVATPEMIAAIAERIRASALEGDDLVVVVSAMGGSTDHLLSLASSVTRRPDLRELDVLLSTGELVSVALLAMALEDLGVKAVSLSGARLGVMTDGVFSRAKIRGISVENIRRELDGGRVVIATGFQGLSDEGQITTLGRGGSDATAVALAAALGAERCEIYTDVEGVYTADPRVVPRARLLPSVTYDEMSELAGLGAKVLQLRAVELGRRYGVRLLVRHAHAPGAGTTIQEETYMNEIVEGALIRGVAHSTGDHKIVVEKLPDEPGVAARVFAALASRNIRVDMIIQGMGRGRRNDIAFTVAAEDARAAEEACREVASEVGARGVTAEEVAKVSLVGAGISQDVRVAAAMFECLAGLGINIEMISTSGTRISCLIRPERAGEAVRALHERFIEPGD